MDTSDSEIVFNEEGYCNHCTDFFSNKRHFTYRGPQSDYKLKDIVNGIRRTTSSGKYDCILGISGGVDSCYMAYICKQLGLRVLLFHLDNGWNTETSVKNIEAVSNYLEYDLQTHVLNWADFKDVQRAHLRASTPEIETPTDISILEHLHRVAIRNNIKYIIMGGNYISESILPKSWHYNPKDNAYSKNIHRLFGEQKVEHFPAFPYWFEAYCKIIKGIKIFYLLNYVSYQKNEALATLKSMGWREYGEKHHESVYTKIVQSYILPQKFNIDYRKATLSNKICNGSISRHDALKQLELQPYNADTIGTDIDYVCKKLELSRTEFDEIMRKQPATYKNYANSKIFLEFIYKIYRRIFKQETFNHTIHVPKNHNILFSIVIPSYNRAQWVVKAIQSVLCQNYTNFEIVVVDDGSTDDTEEVIRALNHSAIRYFKTHNRERGAARNYGVAQSKGDYILFNDSDDILYNHCLGLAAKYIEDNNKPPVFSLAFEIKDVDGKVIEDTSLVKNINERLLVGNPLACFNVVLRRDIAQLFLFNEDRVMAGFEDWELWLRLSARFHIPQIKTISGLMPDHEGRSSHQHTDKTKLIKGVETFMDNVLADSQVRLVYGKKLRFFKSACYSFISLHLAISQQHPKDALIYLFKSLKYNPLFIVENRFGAIFKHLVLRRIADPKATTLRFLHQMGASRVLRNMKGESVTIVSLHRISNEQDYFFDPIKPEVFEELLKYCLQHYHITTFEKIEEWSAKPKLILSFDDGYYDFIEYALPVISKYGVPCNHNLVNACLNKGQIIWTQRMNDVFNHLKSNYITHDELVEKYGSRFNGNWWAYYINFFYKMLSLGKEERNAVINALTKKYDIRKTYRMMTWDDVKYCVENFNVEIGCHTYNHESLNSLVEKQELDNEVGLALREMREKLNLPINILSLPNGQFNETVIEYAKQAGVKYLLLVNGEINKMKSLKSDFNMINRINLINEDMKQIILRIELFHTKLEWVKL